MRGGRLAGLWTMLVPLGCGSGPPDLEPTCLETGCPSGSSCVTTDGDALCLADDPEDYRLALRFVPRRNEAAAQWSPLEEIADIGDSLSTFRFKDAITVRGSVSDGARTLPAFIELRRDAPVPGHEPIVLSRSVRAGSSFEITVPGGADYLLTAWSVDASASFPPRRLILVAADLEDRVTIDVSATVGLTGTVFGTDGTPQPNVRVVALDPETGLAISAPVLTADQGAADAQGTFRLVVPDTTEAVVLRASESDGTWALARPTIASAPTSVPGLIWNEEDRSYQLPTSVLVFPPLNTVILSGTVEGRPRAGGRIAVPGAVLRFSSDDLGAPGIPDAHGRMDRVVRAGADGTFQAELPGGTYDVEITPSADPAVLDLGVGVVSQFVNAAPGDPRQSGLVLEAPQRVAVGGTVEDAYGAPVEGATVFLRGGGQLADPVLAAAERGVRSASIRTTRQGAFLALVDGGHYDAIVRPPEGSGLPWSLRLGLPVAEDGRLADPLVVAPGRLLTGVVLDQSSEGASDVAIEVWCVTPEDDPVLPNAAVLCGQATTDAEGTYEVLLPASLGLLPP